MHDILDLPVTWPWNILLAGFEWHANRVHTWDEEAIFSQHIVYRATHTGHNAHTYSHIGRVGQFDANMRDRRTKRSHAERDHKHRATAHAAIEQAAQRLFHLPRVNPVVGWASVGLAQRADEGS